MNQETPPFRLRINPVSHKQGYLEVIPDIYPGLINLEGFEVTGETDISRLDWVTDLETDEEVVGSVDLELTPSDAKALGQALIEAARTAEVTGEIIRNLGADDAQVRNDAAVRMMDTNSDGAVDALKSAILAPENRGANGTLVYALGHFIPEDPDQIIDEFKILAEVALRHQWEAANTACDLLLKTPFSPDEADRAWLRDFINALNRDGLEATQREALDKIEACFLISPDDEPDSSTV